MFKSGIHVLEAVFSWWKYKKITQLQVFITLLADLLNNHRLHLAVDKYVGKFESGLTYI